MEAHDLPRTVRFVLFSGEVLAEFERRWPKLA